MRYRVTISCHPDNLFETNLIRDARIKAKWWASIHRRHRVKIMQKDVIVESFFCGDYGRSHWQLNDFVSNTINRQNKDV